MFSFVLDVEQSFNKVNFQMFLKLLANNMLFIKNLDGFAEPLHVLGSSAAGVSNRWRDNLLLPPIHPAVHRHNKNGNICL